MRVIPKASRPGNNFYYQSSAAYSIFELFSCSSPDEEIIGGQIHMLAVRKMPCAFQSKVRNQCTGSSIVGLLLRNLLPSKSKGADDLAAITSKFVSSQSLPKLSGSRDRHNPGASNCSQCYATSVIAKNIYVAVARNRNRTTSHIRRILARKWALRPNMPRPCLKHQESPSPARKWGIG